MIILTQNKDAIGNYNNMQGIRIKENQVIGLFVTGLEDDVILLGKYKTNERAKEVLQEIITTYQNFKMYESCTDISGQAGILRALKETNKDLFIYEMPEE